ncbi:collagen alpha-1(I) chain-like [Perognathus longimembris pacificus]|uniref:collagen alpha-1(I) chain-like n=1 Tax=Perognathus longimembris pacificus TaxID=214514 RepID=UPI002018F45D|nr:collagen alpha-1(I) chain-like [Perognathus longimembris pacificus]
MVLHGGGGGGGTAAPTFPVTVRGGTVGNVPATLLGLDEPGPGACKASGTFPAETLNSGAPRTPAARDGAERALPRGGLPIGPTVPPVPGHPSSRPGRQKRPPRLLSASAAEPGVGATARGGEPRRAGFVAVRVCVCVSRGCTPCFGTPRPPPPHQTPTRPTALPRACPPSAGRSAAPGPPSPDATLAVRGSGLCPSACTAAGAGAGGTRGGAGVGERRWSRGIERGLAHPPSPRLELGGREAALASGSGDGAALAAAANTTHLAPRFPVSVPWIPLLASSRWQRGEGRARLAPGLGGRASPTSPRSVGSAAGHRGEALPADEPVRPAALPADPRLCGSGSSVFDVQVLGLAWRFPAVFGRRVLVSVLWGLSASLAGFPRLAGAGRTVAGSSVRLGGRPRGPGRAAEGPSKPWIEARLGHARCPPLPPSSHNAGPPRTRVAPPGPRPPASPGLRGPRRPTANPRGPPGPRRPGRCLAGDRAAPRPSSLSSRGFPGGGSRTLTQVSAPHCARGDLFTTCSGSLGPRRRWPRALLDNGVVVLTSCGGARPARLPGAKDGLQLHGLQPPRPRCARPTRSSAADVRKLRPVGGPQPGGGQAFRSPPRKPTERGRFKEIHPSSPRTRAPGTGSPCPPLTSEGPGPPSRTVPDRWLSRPASNVTLMDTGLKRRARINPDGPGGGRPGAAEGRGPNGAALTGPGGPRRGRVSAGRGEPFMDFSVIWGGGSRGLGVRAPGSPGLGLSGGPWLSSHGGGARRPPPPTGPRAGPSSGPQCPPGAGARGGGRSRRPPTTPPAVK